MGINAQEQKENISNETLAHMSAKLLEWSSTVKLCVQNSTILTIARALMDLDNLLQLSKKQLDLAIDWKKLPKLTLIQNTTTEIFKSMLISSYFLSVGTEFKHIREALSAWSNNQPQRNNFKMQFNVTLDQLETNILKLSTHPLNNAKQCHFQPQPTVNTQPTVPVSLRLQS